MSYLLDTNACIGLLTGRAPSLAEKLRFFAPAEIRLSAVVKGELLYGARRSGRPAENLRLLADFFGFIDQWIGLDQTLLVLTSDHGIPTIPEYVLARTPLSHDGRIGSKTMTAACEAIHEQAFGKP